jgi:hypothetical protein
MDCSTPGDFGGSIIWAMRLSALWRIMAASFEFGYVR